MFFISKFSTLFLIKFIIGICLADSECDPKTCNYAGVCKNVENLIQCECISSIYEGKFCGKVVNYCETSRCPNEVDCVYVNQTFLLI